jgi:hypothetical protein
MNRLTLIALACWAFGGGLRAAPPATPAEILAATIRRVHALLEPAATNARTVTATVVIARADGLAPQLAGQNFQLGFQAPDRLHVKGRLRRQPLELGRHGREVWLWQAAKPLALVGTPDKGTALRPLRLPLTPEQLALLPLVCVASNLAPTTVQGVRCRGLEVRPLPAARDTFQLADFVLTLWLRPADGLPVRVAYRSAEDGLDVQVELRDLRQTPAWPDRAWHLPAPAQTPVKRVALSRWKTALPEELRELLPEEW